ncbi:MAG TPA: DUF2281 domain-containing protein [Vicinamibacterales bacterium]|nr:DUF2281 domain-containing protein [Vicinamibacterales bacterium]
MTKPASGALIDKIQQLSPDRAAEVEDFVDFLTARDSERKVTHAAERLSEASFRAVWDNADDAEYDRL